MEQETSSRPEQCSRIYIESVEERSPLGWWCVCPERDLCSVAIIPVIGRLAHPVNFSATKA